MITNASNRFLLASSAATSGGAQRQDVQPDRLSGRHLQRQRWRGRPDRLVGRRKSFADMERHSTNSVQFPQFSDDPVAPVGVSRLSGTAKTT
jgi:hypothetical protein